MHQRTIIVSVINYPFLGLRDRFVMVRQQLCQDWKLLHGIKRAWLGVKVDDVCRRMLGKILLEFVPRARKDSVARINTRKWPSENVAIERKRFDVTRGRTSSRIKIDLRRLTPDENSVVGGRMLEQVSSSFGTGRVAGPALSSAQLRTR